MDKAAELVRSFESCRLYTYDDADPKARPMKPGQKAKGTPTAGWGHTGPEVTPGLVIDSDQAEVWLWADLVRARVAVEKLGISLTQSQSAALMAFEMNTGGVSTGHDMRAALLEGRLEDVPAQMMRWTHVNGKEWPGLVKRRRAEVALFQGEDWSESAAIPSVLRRGSRGKAVRELQNDLKVLGHFTVEPTGYFGRDTKTAIQIFQATHGLDPDGIVGKATWAALAAALAAREGDEQT